MSGNENNELFPSFSKNSNQQSSHAANQNQVVDSDDDHVGDVHHNLDPVGMDLLPENSDERSIFASDFGNANQQNQSPANERGQSDPSHGPVNAGGSGFLPDLLGEEPQTVRMPVASLDCNVKNEGQDPRRLEAVGGYIEENFFGALREELVAKIRKVTHLIQNADVIRKRYENIADPAGQRTVTDMIDKLLTQRETLEGQLAEAMNTGRSQDYPPRSVVSDSVRQPGHSVNEAEGRPIEPSILVPAPANSVQPAPSESQRVDLSHSVKSLRENLVEVMQRKQELENLVDQLRHRREQSLNGEEKNQYHNLALRHEDRINGLCETVEEAKKTLLAMEALQKQTAGPSGDPVVTHSHLVDEDDDEEEDSPIDPMQLQALRERLGKLRQQIHPPSMEAPATQGASGDVMGVDFRNQATGMPQQNVLSEHTSQWQQVQQVYPPVPRDDRRANAQANGSHKQHRRIGAVVNEAGQATPMSEQRFGSRYLEPSDEYRSLSPFHLDHDIDRRNLNNQGDARDARRFQPPSYHPYQVPQFGRRTDDPRAHGGANELYGLSSKSGDDYYIIDNIHHRTQRRDESAYEPYSHFAEDHSSESDNENFGAFAQVRNAATESDQQKRLNAANPANTKRNDLSVPKKNPNTGSQNNRSRAAVYGDPSPPNRERLERWPQERGSSEIDLNEAAGQNWQGPVSAQHEPIPEVVAALQIIMAEQQKILSSCAQFVSKPSINREDLRAGAETPEQSQNIRGKTQRNGRDIPMIDNFSLRGRGNAAAGRKETDQQPSNAPLNNQRLEGYGREPLDSYRQVHDGRGNETLPDSRHMQNRRESGVRHHEEPLPEFSTIGFPARSNPKSGGAAQRPNHPNPPYQPFSSHHGSQGRFQNRSGDLGSSGQSMGDCKPAPPLADLMIRISKDYESDMGSLHYMLDCIASLQTSASRVVVASQLGLFVAMQHNKSDEDRTRCQGSFPVDELERENTSLNRGVTRDRTRSQPACNSKQTWNGAAADQRNSGPRLWTDVGQVAPDLVDHRHRSTSLKPDTSAQSQPVSSRGGYFGARRNRPPFHDQPQPVGPGRGANVMRPPSSRNLAGSVRPDRRSMPPVSSSHLTELQFTLPREGTLVQPTFNEQQANPQDSMVDLMGQMDVKNWEDEGTNGPHRQENNSGSSGSNGDFDLINDFARQSDNRPSDFTGPRFS